MTPQELRIGNWVHSNLTNVDFTLDIQTLSTMITYGNEDGERVWIAPIPLTEEWLIKFGFERGDNKTISDSFYEIPVGGSSLQINPDNGVVWIKRNDNIFNNPALIEHVHTLQNLYWCLVGEELTIKE